MNLFLLGIIGSIAMIIGFVLLSAEYFFKRRNFFKFSSSIFGGFLSYLLIWLLVMMNASIGKEGNLFYLVTLIFGIFVILSYLFVSRNRKKLINSKNNKIKN